MFYAIVVVAAMTFTSCDTFLQGMATGMGGYGTMYNPYFTPIGVLPYQLQPEVYAEQAKKAAEQSAQMAAQQVVQNAQQMRSMINTMPVTPVYVPVTNGTSSETNTSYNTNSYSSSSTNGRACQRCIGTGKCQTCNGRGYYDVIGIGEGRHACPNCASNHNGKCSSCNGTGKI